ncbi:MAG: hypothetical protein ACLFVO_05865 [Chloroflexaceae bacterium]
MILYYALGGGLGHLTRARAVVHTLGLTGPIVLLTASPYAADPRVTAGMQVIPVPPALERDRHAYRAWLQRLITQVTPDAIYLDAFPAGIQGELCGELLPPDRPVYHLARRLRWPHYACALQDTPPALTMTYQLEPLDPAHAAFLQDHSRAVVPLALVDPPAPPPTPAITRLRTPDRPLWLIAHAGAEDETAELLAYAELLARQMQVQPQLLLVTPQRPAGLPAHVLHLAYYPASALFPLADAIITGGGFNTMRQAAPYAHKHHALPFPRHFDDQFARVARQRANQFAPGRPAQ